MKKFLRNFNRMWKAGFVKSIRLPQIFIPLSIFFALVLTLGSSVFVAYNFSKHTIENFEDRINIVIYFDRKTNTEFEQQVLAQIKARPDVKKVEYKTGKEVLDDFKLKHQDDPITLQALNEISENPFGSSVVVFANNPKSYEVIAKEIEDMNIPFVEDKQISPIENVTYKEHKTAIDSFANVLNKGSLIALIITVALAIILLFTLYLALRFATQGDKEEIKIMRLVGASSMLTVGPTSIMGMLSGLIGAIIAIISMYFLTQNITPYTLAFDSFNAFTWYIKNIKLLLIGNIGFGLLFGFIGSILAVRRYLK
jgi:cell division transport system permease protein